jgi:FkbM family methyltransferase
MLLKCLKIYFRISLLDIKSKLFPILPVWGKSYRRENLHGDILRMLLLQGRLQELLMNKMYGRNVKGVVFDTFNGLLVNNYSDVQMNINLGFNGYYDKSKIEFILSLLNKDACVYIVGAHIGTLVIPLGRFARKVVAFEANPATFEFLTQNIHLNQLNNVDIYNYAIYDKAINIEFYQNKVNSGGSKVKPVTDDYMYNYDAPEVIEVSGKILDDFIEENEIELPDLIIMDIEGAEFPALKGASDCLKHARYLYIEFVPHHLSKVANITVKDFINVITMHFPNMQLVENNMKGQAMKYKDAEILSKLTALYEQNVGADLLFYK